MATIHPSIHLEGTEAPVNITRAINHALLNKDEFKWTLAIVEHQLVL
jgi:hypothetical protein